MKGIDLSKATLMIWCNPNWSR